MVRPLFQYGATVCGIIVGLSMASSVRAESLSEAVQAALTYHPSVEAALLGIDIADQQRKEDKSGYFPVVSLSATGGRVYQDNSTSRGLAVTRGAAYSGFGEGALTMTQKLFDGKQTSSKVEASEARKQSASIDVVDIREGLAMQAVGAYVDVVRARKAIEMLEQHRQKVREYLDRIDLMVEEGASDEAELQQAKNIQSILEGIVADYRGQLRTAETEYIDAMGHIPESDMDVGALIGMDLMPSDSESAVEFAQLNHPALQSEDYLIEASRNDIGAEKASVLPSIDGELSYLKNDKEDVVGGESIDARAVLRLNWDFATGGAELARIRKKKFEHKETMARKAETQKQIERSIRLAYSERDTARNQLGALKERVALLSGLFQTYQAQFEGARISQLQLMQAENQLFNTKLEALNGEHRAIASEYGVLASIGRLQEALNVDSKIADGRK